MSKSRAAGTRWETAVVTYLRDNGFPHAERRALRGSRDAGDLTGIAPGWVLEAKAEKKMGLAGYMTEAEKSATNCGATSFAAIVKRRQKNPADAYVVMPLKVFAALLRDGDGAS